MLVYVCLRPFCLCVCVFVFACSRVYARACWFVYIDLCTANKLLHQGLSTVFLFVQSRDSCLCSLRAVVCNFEAL